MRNVGTITSPSLAELDPSALPFLRSGAEEFSKTKTENEFGIDFAFLSGIGGPCTSSYSKMKS